MLRQRVITAVLLLAVLLPALLWRSPEPFAVVVLVLVAAGAWEWGRLNGLGPARAAGASAGCLALCAWAWQAGWTEQAPRGLWALAGALWVLGGSWVLRQGVRGWPRLPVGVRVPAGILALWLAWLAIAQARVIGVNFLLSIFALVWAADIAAYFAGRALGQRLVSVRLAPGISPGKSWEGAWGGMLAVVVVGLAWRWADAHLPPPDLAASWGLSLHTRLAHHGLGLLVMSLLFLAAMSVVGDLLESLVKRSAGVKDSSGLLPGHGGVLDRVDALLPVMPLAMMLASA